MIWAELVRSTTFRRALMLALALAAVIVALFGFVYWKTDNYLTARSDQMIMTQLNAISLLSDQRLMDAIDAHLKQDSRGVQFAGLFRSDGSRMTGNIVEMPPRPQDRNSGATRRDHGDTCGRPREAGGAGGSAATA